ncbi:MAG: methylated-DNA--[protein]-cysteine S-methyltransferase [Actinomycetota bacterium]
MFTNRTYPTPAGDLNVIARHDGDTPDRPVVVAAGFCPVADLVERLPGVEPGDVRPTGRLGPVDAAMARYLDGDVAALDDVVVDQSGTELQQKVWSELRAIPAGQTRTYTELAAASGRPRAVRAAGTACGRNLIAPFVPCHRALRSDGTLGGYYYGLDVKRWLLAHEAS